MNWNENLLKDLLNKSGPTGQEIFEKFNFPKFYKENFSTQEALIDTEYIIQTQIDKETKFNLYSQGDQLKLKIYYFQHKKLLSDILPLIENLGFTVIDKLTFQFDMSSTETIWVDDFQIEVVNLEQIDLTDLHKKKKAIEDALDKLSKGYLSKDSLSKLTTLIHLDWRQINILKALTRYLHQTGFQYGKGYVQLILVKHYFFTNLLMQFFDLNFNPDNHSLQIAEKIQKQMLIFLSDITSSAEDKVLRSMLELCSAITRTNCYQKDSQGNYKNYLSFKFDSQKVPGLPLPIPYKEIFVFSHEFEGIHLRGGRVARGGLRWSDRGEDYRTEVLGLMKAQMSKNTIIVPVGSKGGFYVKVDPEITDPKLYKELAIESYKNFLRGLLDITDNIVEGKITPPGNVIITDEEDPYLVVAADKGTATFSDYANKVALEYNFWLGDAFASGGSAGYDHKKIAITARGAWIAAERHFKELKINIEKESVSVVAIGDMSGDVFGNGMLSSKNIKLVGAFNHMHIFIDPSPDLEKSYQERLRLFNLPASKWDDYDSNLISKGGGVFLRLAKKITLSEEIKKLLDVKLNEVTPDALICMLLQAPVDMIWNGGIGTYIKASTETHAEIGDKNNDSCRVDAKDVRARIIVEGGNIGVSQKGRIEYSIVAKGLINTDGVDNSAGVNCSDHEVNIKIALNEAVKNNSISLEERDKLLALMTEEVAKLVLQDNYDVTQSISIIEKLSLFTIEIYGKLISILEEEKLLNREVEFLPSKAEINRRTLIKEFLTKPEISVLLAYSKMSAYNDLINSNISTDDYFESFLINYFPKIMQNKFKENILNHPLRKEIITTVIVNKVINRLGPVVLNSAKIQIGKPLCDIMRAYFIINDILDIDALWEEVDRSELITDINVKIDIFSEISKLVRRAIYWLVKYLPTPISIIDSIDNYKILVNKFKLVLPEYLLGETKENYEAKKSYYIEHFVPVELADKVSILDSIVSSFDIIRIAQDYKLDKKQVGEVYFYVGDKFQLDWLRKCCDNLITDAYWNRMSVQSLKDDLYNKQVLIAVSIVKSTPSNFDKWNEEKSNPIQIFEQFMDEIKAQKVIDFSMLIIANKKLETFLQCI